NLQRKEPEEITDEATDYLLLGFSDTEKILGAVPVNIQKTDIEDIVSMEVDDEGKLVTILILNASTRMPK
ncbi:6424_t:CDS:2, partial [Paraglomus occultum]